ncbi:MAG: TIGR01212 family radical SAM protein [Marinilabiliales bacterium]|nr:MAG: TIGR01212 family radical SAM protein [Marinilabiliales bacterium]
MIKFPSDRRYNSLSVYLREKYMHRLQKISVNAGFTCPNRDGSVAVGGCTYCENKAFNPSYCDPGKSIKQQVEEGLLFLRKRYKNAGEFMVYFQPYSNTYDSVDKLETIYNEALAIPDVSGIVVSTRPDCVDEEKLQLLSDLSQSHYVFLEMGIESVFDKSLKRMNRGHDFKTSVQAFEMAAKYSLFTTGHYILGLPGESREEMLESAGILSEIPMKAIKLHQLQIVKGTEMHKDFENNPNDYKLFEREEYLDFAVSFCERLRPDLLIDRFAGEVPLPYLIAPKWGLFRYDQVMQMIEKRFEERNTWQGRLYEE